MQIFSLSLLIITVPNSNRKIVEIGKIYTPNTWPLNSLSWYKHFDKTMLAIYHLCHGENKLCFDEIMLISAWYLLCARPTHCVVFYSTRSLQLKSTQTNYPHKRVFHLAPYCSVLSVLTSEYHFANLCFGLGREPTIQHYQCECSSKHLNNCNIM